MWPRIARAATPLAVPGAGTRAQTPGRPPIDGARSLDGDVRALPPGRPGDALAISVRTTPPAVTGVPQAPPCN